MIRKLSRISPAFLHGAAAVFYIASFLLVLPLIPACRPDPLRGNLTGLGIEPCVNKGIYYGFLFCILSCNAIESILFFKHADNRQSAFLMGLSWMFMAVGVLIPWSTEYGSSRMLQADLHLLFCGCAFFLQLLLFIKGTASLLSSKTLHIGCNAALLISALSAFWIGAGHCVNLVSELCYAFLLPPVLGTVQIRSFFKRAYRQHRPSNKEA